MLIRIGYSGSRHGMTTPQMRGVHDYLSYVLLVNDNDPDVAGIEFHHGDCDGGDAEAHVIATVLGCRTVAHPPRNPAKRAWCKADEIRPPKDYLARDWDIAYETRELLATPKILEPDLHSGTWITTGYAAQIGRPATVFRPADGMRVDGREFFRPGIPTWPCTGSEKG